MKNITDGNYQEHPLWKEILEDRRRRGLLNSHKVKKKTI